MAHFQRFFLLLLSFLPLLAICQEKKDSNMQNLLNRLQIFGERIPQEKVFVHMDNTSYFQGDTIWFSAYTRQTNTGQPSQMSAVLYVELLNQEGYLMERKLIEMKKGRGDGFFALNYPVQYSGFYELRAYTRWQLNWGMYEHKHSQLSQEWFLNKNLEKEFFRDYEKLYSRVFPVYDKPNCPENPERIMTGRILRRRFKEEANTRNKELTFFPEGGELLEGVPCRVAFEAAWDDGEWLEGTLQVKGQSIETVHRGRGTFFLTVQSGEIPEAIFICKDGSSIRKKLPQAQKTGAALSVTHSDDKWHITVQLSQDILPNKVGLTVMNEGNLCHSRTLEQQHNAFTFQTDELKEGVNQVTVFNDYGKILADRLFFVIKPHSIKPSLVIKSDKENYNPYERIDITIEGRKGMTPVSVAVRDRQQSESIYDNGNILTEMLLASEVRGFIPHPDWYFQADDTQHQEALDLLMMTQGWRRFEWKNMAIQGAWDLTQPAEKAPIIIGSVYDFDVESLMGEKERRKNENKQITTINDKENHPDDVTITTQADARKKLKQILGAKTNLKREVKVHAELFHSEKEIPIIGETHTKNRAFSIQLPRFYGDCIFFLSAADTTKWKEGEQYTWIQMKSDEADLPLSKRWRYRIPSADLFVRVSFPYPNFVKKYSFHQQRSDTTDRFSTKEWRQQTDETTIMNQINVEGKRVQGLRLFDETQPAMLVDAYEAINKQYDAGMFFTDVVRAYVCDYGLEAPYIHDKNGFLNEKLGILWGIDQLTKAQEGLTIPPDSVYHRKYLKVYKEKRSFPQRKWLTYQQNTEAEEFITSKYGIYTDYCPRMEGSIHYQGSNLPETYRANFPFPNEDQRVIYRDRRYILPGFSYPAECYSPDYSKQTPPDSMPDYRRTLYWNPNVMLDRNGKAHITLYNNARAKEIHVNAEGLADDGTLLWGEK